MAELGILIFAYVVTASIGLRMDAVSGFATLVWPPTGIVFAALILAGLRVWPGVFLGAMIANLSIGAPVYLALGIGLGNTFEGVLAAYLLGRVVQFRSGIERLRDAVGFVAVTAGLATVVGATVGVLAMWSGGIVAQGQMARTWSAWWLGDLLGALVVGSAFLTWSGFRQPWACSSRQLVEALGLIACATGVGLFVFLRAPVADHDPFRQAFLVFPVLLWAAIRFGPRGTTATMLLLSAIAIGGTAIGSGPFVGETLSQSLFSLQAFMAVATVTSLVLAAALAERREALSSEKQMLAVVSHDLKNSLTVIRLSAAQLLRQPPTELGARARRQVEAVERASGNMAAMLRDLLDEAIIRVGHLTLKSEVVDLTGLINDAAQLARPLATQKSQALAVEVQCGLKVRGDRERILQVLSNFLGNAIKFTPETGSIALRSEASDGWAHCFVSDSGPGIEPSQLRHVFEPFWTGDSEKGTGLGLSIAKGIVEAHTGKVWIESTAGAGTTVAFSLPLAT